MDRAPERQTAPLQEPAHLVSMALGADRATGRKVLAASHLANAGFQADCDRLARGTGQPVATLDWPGATTWTRALRADGRPLILAALHLGNYLSALLALAAKLAWLGRVTVICSERDMPLDRAALSHCAAAGLTIEFARSGESPARQALRTLRSGGHVLLMHDTPPSCDRGRTLEVPFFGRSARFAAGPAALAWHTGALLWPLALPRVDGRVALRTQTPAGVDTRAAIAPATAALARFAQRCITETPAQWLLWPQLAGFWSATQESTSARVGPGRAGGDEGARAG